MYLTRFFYIVTQNFIKRKVDKMNEKENVETSETVVSDVSGNDGLSVDDISDSGIQSIDEYTGSGEEITNSVSDGNATDESYTTNYGGSVSGNDYSGSDAWTSVDYTENLEKIESGINGINSLLLLVFVFLLFEWTEKKFSVIVKRFGERKRR